MGIEDLEGVQRANVNLTRNSDQVGFVLITIGSPAVDIQPDYRPCLSCLVQQKSGTQAYLSLAAPATTGAWKLSATASIPVPVKNLDLLHFIGTAGDIIQILWRN